MCVRCCCSVEFLVNRVRGRERESGGGAREKGIEERDGWIGHEHVFVLRILFEERCGKRQRRDHMSAVNISQNV